MDNCISKQGNGGGIIFSFSKTITLKSSFFKQNNAHLGGAIYIDNC